MAGDKTVPHGGTNPSGSRSSSSEDERVSSLNEMREEAERLIIQLDSVLTQPAQEPEK